ncbi:MAG: chemotaxis protein CheW [Pirellulales bacterium]
MSATLENDALPEELQDSTLALRTTDQFLTFELAGQQYGIDILRVQEIKVLCPITSIPSCPSYYKGIINLRGAVIPIIDLKAKLTLPESSYGNHAVIIVANCGKKTAGLVVDSVSEVLDIPRKSIDEVPSVGEQQGCTLIGGIARTEQALVSLVNIERLFDETSF